jgi:polyphosphate kinase 2 (PPK2 family)
MGSPSLKDLDLSLSLSRRPQYEEAVENMLARTGHELGPWQLVEAESKPYARVKVIETTIAQIERGMRERGFVVVELPER